MSSGPSKAALVEILDQPRFANISYNQCVNPKPYANTSESYPESIPTAAASSSSSTASSAAAAAAAPAPKRVNPFQSKAARIEAARIEADDDDDDDDDEEDNNDDVIDANGTLKF